MRKTGRDTSDQGNFHTKLGNLMEEVVAKLFLDEKKEYVGTKNVSVYQHDTIEFATCTPDYFLHTPISSGTEALLEIKTSGAWANKDWSEGIPDYALIQLQWQLGIMNSSQGYLAALIGGKEFYIKEVPFNADVFSQLVEMGTKFVEMIKSDTAPDATFNDDFSFLKPTEREVELSDCAEMLQEYQLLSNELAVSNSFIRLNAIF
jgi:predicted phage-related endonuclease